MITNHQPLVGAQKNGGNGRESGLEHGETNICQKEQDSRCALDEPSTAIPDSERNQKKEYYSLKDYREGPNPESGEFESQQDHQEVKSHNEDVESRHRSY